VIDAALQALERRSVHDGPLLKRDLSDERERRERRARAADFVLPSALGFHADAAEEDIDNERLDEVQERSARPHRREAALRAAGRGDAGRDVHARTGSARHDKDEDRRAVLLDRYRKRVGTALINFKSRMGAPPDPEIVEHFFTSPDAGATSPP
jgi:hypothetical protein